MRCNEALNTQAWFDGERTGIPTDEVERHVAACPECRELIDSLGSTRRTLRSEMTYHAASKDLRNRLAVALDEEVVKKVSPFKWRRSQFWKGAASGAMAMAAAAALAIFVLSPPDSDEIIADVTNAHIRSLVGMHLVDFGSHDPKATNSWLAAHTELSPPAHAVPAGFQLVGVRADYVYGSSSAVIVYRKNNHTVNVFAWIEKENEDLPERAENKGYNVVFWKHGVVVFCAVSNLPVEDLEKFSHAMRSA